MSVPKRKNKTPSVNYSKRFNEILTFLESNKWLLNRVRKPLPVLKLFKNCQL